MTEISNELSSWTVNFVKNKDLLQKKLQDIKVEKDKIVFEFKDKSHTYFIEPELEIKTEKDFVTCVCLNTKKNVETLYKNWDKIKKNEKLSILFVNLNNHEKWMIFPYTHNKITEPKSLKPGLMSMMDNAGRS